jgi:hypothetical protein
MSQCTPSTTIVKRKYTYIKKEIWVYHKLPKERGCYGDMDTTGVQFSSTDESKVALRITVLALLTSREVLSSPLKN